MDQQARRSASPRTDSVISDERFERYHDYARRKGVNKLLYYVARMVLVPCFLVWFRLQRTGREHARLKGGMIVASNHRSFLDPFVIGALAALAAPDPVRRQGRAVREALAGLDPLPPRRLPDPPRPVGRDRDGDRAPGPRARRHRRASSPRARGSGSGSLANPKRGVGRLALEIGRRRAAGRGARLRARSPRPADPPAQGEAARRQGR